MEFVRRWIEKSPYSAALGVQLESLTEGAARLRLPFAEPIINPGGVLHGGCAASLATIGAHAVTRAALGEASGPWISPGLQVNYLAAAQELDVSSESRLLRRGKTICFVEVDVATQEGKSIAHATALTRARFGEDYEDYCLRVPRFLPRRGSASP